MTPKEQAQSLMRSIEAAVHPAMRQCVVGCMENLLIKQAQQTRDQALLEGWDAAIAALRSHSRADYSTESPKHLAHWLGTYRALKSTARPEYMQLFLSQGEIERFRGLLEAQGDHPHPDDAGLMRKLTTMRDNLAKAGASE